MPVLVNNETIPNTWNSSVNALLLCRKRMIKAISVVFYWYGYKQVSLFNTIKTILGKLNELVSCCCCLDTSDKLITYCKMHLLLLLNVSTWGYRESTLSFRSCSSHLYLCSISVFTCEPDLNLIIIETQHILPLWSMWLEYGMCMA